MSFELNQTAVSAAPLLRAIEAGGWTTNAELATRAGRAPKNISRDLGILRNEGLIEPDAVILTDLGQAQLAAIARAENAAPALAEDERLVTHSQMRPDPDNPRKDFDSADAQEKLDELRTSILEKGLLQNFVCRPDHSGEADYIVTDGNRRWHAIAQAVFDADWPEDRLLRIKVLDTDECESLITAVVANMQRADMSPLEEAEAFDKLINAHGLKTIDIANQTGLSQKVVQNRLKLLKLSEDDRDRMRLPEDHADHLNYKAALKSLTVAREPAAEPAPDEIEHQEPERRLLTVADFGVPADWRATDVAGAASWIEPFTMERFEYRDKKWTLTIQVAQLVGGEGWVHGTSSEGPTQGSYSTLNGVWSGHMPAYQTREKAIACAAAYISAGVLGKAPEKAMAWLANPTADEPGSPAEAPAGAGAPSLGKTLSDVEALIIAEVADKAERHPHPIHPSYALCLPTANQAGVPHLVARGLLATRVIGGDMLIRPALHAGGVKEWLESIGFYGDREELLFELAARVQGGDNVIIRQQSGVRYATAWLNLTGDPRNDAAEPAPVRDHSQDTADALAYGMAALEPEQPALIEETAEEKAARRRAEQMAAEAAFDDRAIMAFAETMRRKMALKRSQGASGWAGASVNDLADLLVGHVAKGDPVDIALFAMMVAHRAEAVGYQRTPDVLRTMPTPRMEQLMIEARANRGPAPDAPECADPAALDYDPETTFVEAELDDAEAAVDPEEATTPRTSAEPAVPIRKSITPDFIVCLEDGRKFKSLKRHLRTKYNLSPEEYRARWGLPRDYPMVAPNYAKARADLARQMGIAQ